MWAKWAVSRWRRFPSSSSPDPSCWSAAEGWLRRTRIRHRRGQDGLPQRSDRVNRSGAPSGTPIPAAADDESSDTGARPPPLLVQSVTRSETELLTDRGLRRLPAWRLQAADDAGSHLGPRSRYRTPGVATTGTAAAPRPALASPIGDPGARRGAGPDDATLTVDFLVPLPEFERYPRAEIIESAHAIAIVPAGHDIGPPGIRILPGHMHQVAVRLTRPLGARVFVDLHGNAGQVDFPDRLSTSETAVGAGGLLGHRGVAGVDFAGLAGAEDDADDGDAEQAGDLPGGVEHAGGGVSGSIGGHAVRGWSRSGG